MASRTIATSRGRIRSTTAPCVLLPNVAQRSRYVLASLICTVPVCAVWCVRSVVGEGEKEAKEGSWDAHARRGLIEPCIVGRCSTPCIPDTCAGLRVRPPPTCYTDAPGCSGRCCVAVLIYIYIDLTQLCSWMPCPQPTKQRARLLCETSWTVPTFKSVTPRRFKGQPANTVQLSRFKGQPARSGTERAATSAACIRAHQYIISHF